MGRRNSGAKEECAEKEGRLSGITFDAGGLIALDRNDRKVITLLARAAERGLRTTIPATALAQAIRNPARQARLRRLMRQTSTDLLHSMGRTQRLLAYCLREVGPRISSMPTSPFAPSELVKLSSPAIRGISGGSRQACGWSSFDRGKGTHWLLVKFRDWVTVLAHR